MKTRLFLLAALLIFVCTSCFKDYDEDTVDNNDEIIEQLKSVCDSMTENTHVPGLVAGVWAPDKGIELVYASGVADLESGDPIEDAMTFRIGSNTKTFVVTRFLQLVDSGYVSMQDKLEKFYPNFPKSNMITLEMLTDMTSGITSYSQLDTFQQVMINDPMHVWSMDDLIDLSRNEPFHFEPGEGIDYCNTNTQLIGRIIEMITQDDLEHQLRKHIFEPLNLENTYYLPSGNEIPGFHPKGYYSGIFEEDNPEYSESFDISWAQAAGAMVSTIYDLRKYVTALSDGTFLSDSLQQTRMAKRIFFHEPDIYYSIGAAWFNIYYGHDGGLPGFTSTMVHSNEKNCTIIVWYNCNLNDEGIRADHIFRRFDQIVN